MLMVCPALHAAEKPFARPLLLNPPEGVQEANDRDYYPAVRRLIASARKTIDLSLDAVSLDGEPSDPVQFLINDLLDAARRGIKVRFFVSTRSGSAEDLPLFLSEDILASLRKESIEVHYINPHYAVFDRLMIVDGEWVLEGGLRWTRADLNNGLGSSTLSRSAELANKKRVRLELLPLWDVEVRKQETKEGTVPVPVYLMKDLKYFPGMVSAEDSDALKIYLALLRTFFMQNSVHLTVPLEDLVSEIPADQHFARAEASFQVIKTLERLEKTYELIKLEQKGPERAELTLVMPQDLNPAVNVPLPFFQENYAKQLSSQAILAYLIIRLKAQASGESPVWLGSERNVEQDFPMTREKFRMGATELRKLNLIEVFPFQLEGKYSHLENTEYRYVLNPVPTLSERLQTWTRLRDQYGDDDFKRAKELAETLNEDEDPKVLAVYLDLMKRYTLDDLLGMTQHIASLPDRSTPERLAYLRELLEHETHAPATAS